MEMRLFKCEVKNLVQMPFHNVAAILTYIAYCEKTLEAGKPFDMECKFEIAMCISSDPNLPQYQVVHNGSFKSAKEFCEEQLKNGVPIRIVAFP